MAINIHNLRVSNMTVGPLSGGGNGGGGGGSSEPSYLAVGAWGVNSNTGTAYVYDATNYSATPTRITPSGLGAADNFGWSIASNGNQIAVGAPQDDDQAGNAGAVYVYDTSNLSATPIKLAPSGLGSNDYSGISVAATSNQIVIGAFGDSDRGSFAGAVYVYDATNLSATPTKLAPTGLGANDHFGSSVTATSNQIVVGARYDDDQGTDAGAVYVYDATNLSATPTKLAPSGLDASDYFGESVAATSNQIVVGARYDGDQGNQAGAVYVYDANNLSATPTKLAPSGLEANDYFGQSVAASSNYIVVGAVRDDDRGGDAGAVYVYDATNLSATPTKLAPSGLDADDEFGHSVAAYGNQIVVGAKSDDDQSTSTTIHNLGAVYVYDANNLSASPTKLAPSDLGANFEFGNSVSLG